MIEIIEKIWTKIVDFIKGNSSVQIDRDNNVVGNNNNVNINNPPKYEKESLVFDDKKLMSEVN